MVPIQKNSIKQILDATCTSGMDHVQYLDDLYLTFRGEDGERERAEVGGNACQRRSRGL